MILKLPEFGWTSHGVIGRETVIPYIYDQGNTVTVALMGEDDSHSKAIIEFRSKSSPIKINKI